MYDAAWSKIAPLAQGAVLDFGAGTGAMATRLANEPRVEAVFAADLASHAGEPFTGAALAKIRWVTADLNAPLAMPAASFDVIVALEIIEHLENPRAVAREWRRLLRPGGALVMSTPNVESTRSILSLFARGHHAAFTGKSYPAHITPLTRLDVERVLTEAGFGDVRFSWSGFGLVPTLSVSWQQLSGGILAGMRFSDNLVATARAS